MKVWQKKYKLNEKIEKFTVGNDYLLDQKLLKHDVAASMTHAKMLEKIGVLTSSENKKLQKQLQQILKLDEKGKFKIKLSDEDSHTAIENFLVKSNGLGRKIHTGRSRNDQSIAAIRLYVRQEAGEIKKQTELLIKVLKQKIRKNGEVKIPGYTHMQRAMPSSIGLWLGAFVESLQDDLISLEVAKKINNQSPLGSAAGYGTPIKVDRNFVAKELKFRKVQNNTLYVQNSRGKFELIMVQALQQIAHDLNKMAADIMLFSTVEFGFIGIPDEFCTGSSMMPHKKNADVLEITRAKYGVICGYANQISIILGSLPSGYNRDLQLTKEALIKSFDTVKETINIMRLVVANMQINKENCSKAMSSELYETEKVYKMVKEGKAFRDAYREVAG